jgi:hypothetical protein
MALLSNGDITTVKDSTLLIAANTIPGDVVEVYRNDMYMGAARPREGNPNWQIDVRLPFYGEHTYEARIRRGTSYSAKASIVINYEEPTPILSDTFAGEISTVIHDHSPDIGLTWIRKYDVVNNYDTSVHFSREYLPPLPSTVVQEVPSNNHPHIPILVLSLSVRTNVPSIKTKPVRCQCWRRVWRSRKKINVVRKRIQRVVVF